MCVCVCEEKCKYLIVSCEWECGKVIRRKDVVEHEQNVCPNRPWYLKFDDNYSTLFYRFIPVYIYNVHVHV